VFQFLKDDEPSRRRRPIDRAGDTSLDLPVASADPSTRSDSEPTSTIKAESNRGSEGDAEQQDETASDATASDEADDPPIAGGDRQSSGHAETGSPELPQSSESPQSPESNVAADTPATDDDAPATNDAVGVDHGDDCDTPSTSIPASDDDEDDAESEDDGTGPLVDTESAEADQPTVSDLSTSFHSDTSDESFIEIFDEPDDGQPSDAPGSDPLSASEEGGDSAPGNISEADTETAPRAEPPIEAEVTDQSFIEVFDHTDDEEAPEAAPVALPLGAAMSLPSASQPTSQPATRPLGSGQAVPAERMRSLPDREPRPPIPANLLPTLIISEVPRLRRLAAAILGEEALADRLAQMTVERALADPACLHPETSLAVALFALMHESRNQMQRPPGGDMPGDDGDLKTAPRFEATLLRPLPGADRDELRVVARAMAGLGEKEREILLLIALENLSYRDVAIVVKVPFGRVMAHVARAREKLRQALLWDKGGGDDRHDDGPDDEGMTA
jgi:RNA polymerase sigma-70 factor (ECF subfamily)